MKSYLPLLLTAMMALMLSCGNEKKDAPATEDAGSGEALTEHQWTDKNKLEFERNCVGFLEREGVENAKQYCDCLLEASVESYPDPAVAFELEQNDIVTLFENSKCLDDLLLIKLEDPWTEEVEQLFVQHCQEAQKDKGVSENDASEYCDCALAEVKKIVPNPHHVMSLTQEELDHVLAKCAP